MLSVLVPPPFFRNFILCVRLLAAVRHCVVQATDPFHSVGQAKHVLLLDDCCVYDDWPHLWRFLINFRKQNLYIGYRNGPYRFWFLFRLFWIEDARAEEQREEEDAND